MRKIHERPVVEDAHPAWSARGRAARKPRSSRLIRWLMVGCLGAGACLLLGVTVDDRFLWGFYGVFVVLLIAFLVCRYLEPLDQLDAERLPYEPRIPRWPTVVAVLIACGSIALGITVDAAFLHVGIVLAGLIGLRWVFHGLTPGVALGLAAYSGAMAIYQWLRAGSDSPGVLPGTGETSAIVTTAMAVMFLVAALWLGSRRLVETIEDQAQ